MIRALNGLKVADFSWVLAGPSVGRVLADNGATVVRVESATRPDLARFLSPFNGGEPRPDNSALAADVNTGKLGLSLNLALPEAQPAIYLTLSLGITFPFNLTIGIPLYAALAGWIAG